MNKNLYVCVSGKVLSGEPIGLVYREASSGPSDSGWKIMSGTEDMIYASNPDNSYTIKFRKLLKKFPELEAIGDAKKGAVFVADENGELVLREVDKSLSHVDIRLFTKNKYVVSVGVPFFITADVEDERFFIRKPGFLKKK